MAHPLEVVSRSLIQPELEARWKEACPDVDAVFDELAGQHDTKPIAYFKSPPATKAVVWHTDGVGFQVSVLLNAVHAEDPNEIKLMTSAWIDNIETGIRRVARFDPIDFSAPIDGRKFREEAEQRAVAVAKTPEILKIPVLPPELLQFGATLSGEIGMFKNFVVSFSEKPIPESAKK